MAMACLVPAIAFGDGIVIPQLACAIPDIPEQRALIHYADDTEMLVIEASFIGEGDQVLPH